MTEHTTHVVPVYKYLVEGCFASCTCGWLGNRRYGESGEFQAKVDGVFHCAPVAAPIPELLKLIIGELANLIEEVKEIKER